MVERARLYIGMEQDAPRPGTLSMVRMQVSSGVTDAAERRADSTLERDVRYAAGEELRRLLWQEAAIIAVMSGKQNELLDEAGAPIDNPGTNMLTSRVQPITSFDPRAEHMPIDEAITRLADHVTGRRNMTDVAMKYAEDLREKFQAEASTPTLVTSASSPKDVSDPTKGDSQPARGRRFSFSKLRRRPRGN